jgi:hypothetical protein
MCVFFIGGIRLLLQVIEGMFDVDSSFSWTGRVGIEWLGAAASSGRIVPDLDEK